MQYELQNNSFKKSTQKDRDKTVPSCAVHTNIAPAPPSNAILARNLQTELKEGFLYKEPSRFI